MSEEQTPPLRRTLGDSVMHQGHDILLVLQYMLPPGPWR